MEGPEGTRLASQAFEAINEAVRSAAADTLPLVGQLIPLTLQKLNATMAMAAAAPDARERQSELQARHPWAHASKQILFLTWRADAYFGNKELRRQPMDDGVESGESHAGRGRRCA